MNNMASPLVQCVSLIFLFISSHPILAYGEVTKCGELLTICEGSLVCHMKLALLRTACSTGSTCSEQCLATVLQLVKCDAGLELLQTDMSCMPEVVQDICKCELHPPLPTLKLTPVEAQKISKMVIAPIEVVKRMK